MRTMLLGLMLVVANLAAAQEPVLFQDRFDGRPADGWTWLREDAKTWRQADGALEIRVEPVAAGNVKNALVRTPPDRRKGNYAVEVTVTFTAPPTHQFEQAGITWYQGGQPKFKLVHENIDGSLFVVPGKVPAPDSTVQLRLELRGEKIEAKFRAAGGQYKTVHQGDLPIAAGEQVSIQCYQGPENETHWVRFDDFRIVEIQ